MKLLKLDIRRAQTDADFEGMRLVRNACRLFMTDNTHEISPEEQEQWRQSIMPPQVFPYTVRLVDQPEVVIGYGLIQRAGFGDPYWITGALLEEHRGRGLGRELFTHLVALAGRPCWLQVRSKNTTARRLYETLGFVYTANAHRVAADGVFTMVLQ